MHNITARYGIGRRSVLIQQSAAWNGRENIKTWSRQ